MNKIMDKLIKNKKRIIIIYLLITIIMTFCFMNVKINYNMQDYLPEDANSTKALSIMKDNFDDEIANTKVMLSNLSIDEVLEIEEKIKKIDGVINVSWLDSMIDINQLSNINIDDISSIDEQTKNVIEKYYKDNNALIDITIENGKEQYAVNKIYELIGNNYMIGTAVEQANAQNIALNQSIKAIILIAPLIIIILVLSTTSWIEPFIYLSTIGIAVIINLGISILRGSISYVTLAVAPLLQLAVSLDYAVFLSSSFDKYRKDNDINRAMKLAMKDSIKSISASALTTLFGFIALLFMKFKIGPDMGISLVIGVILSFIAVLTLLPSLILSTYKLNDKLKHKSFISNFSKLSNLIIKTRIPIFIILIFFISFSYTKQSSINYIYGSGDKTPDSRIYLDNKKIESVFGKNNMIAILVPIGNYENEKNLNEELNNLDYITNIVSYANNVGFDIPIKMIDNKVKSNFYSNNYSRIILYTKLEDEGDYSFSKIEEIKKIVNKYYDNTYMCGNTVNMYDMKNTIKNDQKIVSFITIISIFIILLIEFKSIIIPIILIFIVKGSIWITLFISSINGDSLNYLGYLVVSTVMMGATIDYSILITDNYLKYRKKLIKKEAIIETLKTSIKSILVSSSTLAFAGFALGLTSSESVVKSLGLMLGEGTVISFIISITLLPSILYFIDRLLPKLSLKMNLLKNEKD